MEDRPKKKASVKKKLSDIEKKALISEYARLKELHFLLVGHEKGTVIKSEIKPLRDERDGLLTKFKKLSGKVSKVTKTYAVKTPRGTKNLRLIEGIPVMDEEYDALKDHCKGNKAKEDWLKRILG